MRGSVVLVDRATAPGLPTLLATPELAHFGFDEPWRVEPVPGDRAAQLRSFAEVAAAAGAGCIVVWCGGLDVRAGRPIADVVHHVAEALDAVTAGWPDVRLAVAAVPTGRGRWAGAVATFDGELARVARQRGAVWLDPRRGRSDVTGRSLPWWTDRSGHIRRSPRVCTVWH